MKNNEIIIALKGIISLLESILTVQLFVDAVDEQNTDYPCVVIRVLAPDRNTVSIDQHVIYSNLSFIIEIISLQTHLDTETINADIANLLHKYKDENITSIVRTEPFFNTIVEKGTKYFRNGYMYKIIV